MKQSRGAWLAGLLFTMAAAHAAPPSAEPPPEALHAEKDSAFIQRLLREPFGGTHDQAELQAAVLRSSGTAGDEAQRLQLAEQRRLLAKLTGDPYQRPRTVGEAIALEEKDGKVDGLPALERVSIGFAAPAAARTLGIPPGATQAGPAVWTVPHHQLPHVYVAVTIHNGLAVPLREAGFQFGRTADGKYLVSLSCELHRLVEPGKDDVALCSGFDRAERIDPAVAALVARTPPGPFRAGWVRTTDGNDLFGRVGKEISGDGPSKRARALLTAATCGDKASCAVIAKAQSDRRAAEWRDKRGRVALGFGMVAAVVLGIVAALRVREPGPGGWFVSTLAVGVVLYALLAAAATYVAVMPHAGYAALPAAALVIFGGLPYLVALGTVGAALNSNATRLRAFAAAFGAVAALTIGGALFLSP